MFYFLYFDKLHNILHLLIINYVNIDSYFSPIRWNAWMSFLILFLYLSHVVFHPRLCPPSHKFLPHPALRSSAIDLRSFLRFLAFSVNLSSILWQELLLKCSSVHVHVSAEKSSNASQLFHSEEALWHAGLQAPHLAPLTSSCHCVLLRFTIL